MHPVPLGFISGVHDPLFLLGATGGSGNLVTTMGSGFGGGRIWEDANTEEKTAATSSERSIVDIYSTEASSDGEGFARDRARRGEGVEPLNTFCIA